MPPARSGAPPTTSCAPPLRPPETPWQHRRACSPPDVLHPLTDGVATYAWVNHTTFDLGDDALVLGTSGSAESFLAVLEPATGFAEGGRVVVLGDHNLFTDTFIADADNTALAANVVAWANGECGNTLLEHGEGCDDGNRDDGDGCSAACEVENDAGTTTGGAESTSTGNGSTSTGAVESTSSGVGDGSSTSSGGESSPSTGLDETSTGDAGVSEGSTSTTAPASDTSTGRGASDTDAAAAEDESSGCTSGGHPSPWMVVVLLLGLRRRRG